MDGEHVTVIAQRSQMPRNATLHYSVKRQVEKSCTTFRFQTYRSSLVRLSILSALIGTGRRNMGSPSQSQCMKLRRSSSSLSKHCNMSGSGPTQGPAQALALGTQASVQWAKHVGGLITTNNRRPSKYDSLMPQCHTGDSRRGQSDFAI